MDDALYRKYCDRLKVCVIVPTYNNGKTLRRVLDGILAYTSNIIVVNDGSTDNTKRILEDLHQITIIHLAKNSGKGIALRTGFKRAIEAGYSYAITIDSDGQHFANDLPVFIDALKDEGGTLFIGSRNMAQDGVPKKSSFGNKFSNFWFWFETGIRLDDTQSGYRLYPLKLIPKKYVTPKFEFEIEVIVRSAWKGIAVKNIPIQVSYNPAERVSHFRPFRDFTRISILNTVLVIITLLYIKPRDFFFKFKKKGVKKFFLENILHNEDSNARKSLSIALGVFIGIAPFWGFQSALAIILAAVLKLNKTISFAFSNVSVPPCIPFILYGSFSVGAWLTNTKMPVLITTSVKMPDIKTDLLNYLLGSVVFGAIMGVISGLSGFVVLSTLSALKSKK